MKRAKAAKGNEEKNVREAVTPTPILFQSRLAAVPQQRQPAAVADERKLSFDFPPEVVPPEVVEMFRRGMFRDNTELDLNRSLVPENFPFFNGRYLDAVTVGSVISFLSANPSVAYVDLCEMQMVDADLARLAKMPGVKSWRLMCLDSTDAGMKNFEGNTTIESLDFQMCTHVTDAALAYFATMSQLQCLHLAGCERMNADLAILTQMQRLKSLALSGSIKLAPLPALKALSLLQTDITNKGFADFLKDHRGITCLELSQIDEVLATTIKDESSITDLTLVNCQNISNAIIKILAGITRLQRLKFQNCTEITEGNLLVLAGIPGLETLIVDTGNLTDAGAQALATAWAANASLTVLDISPSYQIGEAGKAALGQVQQDKEVARVVSGEIRKSQTLLHAYLPVSVCEIVASYVANNTLVDKPIKLKL